MRQTGLVLGALGRAVAGTVIGASLLAAMPAQAARERDPGFYFGFNAFGADLDRQDAVFSFTVPGTPGTPATECLIEDPFGTGQNIDLGPLGCVIGTSDPGTPGVPGSRPNDRGQGGFLEFKNAVGGGFSFGYNFAGGLRPELAISYVEHDVERSRSFGVTNDDPDNASLESLSAMANAWYDINFGIPLMPYLGGGAGLNKTQLTLNGSEADFTKFAYQFGGGLDLWLGDHTIVSLDYRYFVSDNDTYQFPGTTEATAEVSEFQSQRIGLGLKYVFAGLDDTDTDGDGVPDRKDKCPNTPKGVQVYSDGCPLDLDGDGVPDYLDKCPGTPPGVRVNAQGCEIDSDGDGVADSKDQCPGTPRGVKVSPNGCPLDSDGDGVPDQFDKCPGSPPGIAVGPDGCPLDSDGDGIPDYLDECPRSPPGAKVLPNGCALKGDCRKPRPGEQVDENGCALEQRFILRGVKFEFDSDRLLPESKIILNDVAATLQSYPDVKVEVEGHTDNIGTDAYNLGLSERRANSVKTYLAGRGVSTARMVPVGYGESRPIANNDQEAGREENRRVEFKVIE